MSLGNAGNVLSVCVCVGGGGGGGNFPTIHRHNINSNELIFAVFLMFIFIVLI